MAKKKKEFTEQGIDNESYDVDFDVIEVAAFGWDGSQYVALNETFDFQLYNKATAITGSKIRRKFGASGDFGSMSAGGVVSIASGDKLSLAISNEDSAANLTIRNLTIVLVRL